MDPLIRCIYPDCNKLAVLSTEQFCSACGRLCRCPHEDCQAVLDFKSLGSCPKCHKSIKATLTQRDLEDLGPDQATFFISNDANHADQIDSLSHTVGSLTPGHADQIDSLSHTVGSLTPPRNDANHAPTVSRALPPSLTDANHAPTVSRVSPPSLFDTAFIYRDKIRMT